MIYDKVCHINTLSPLNYIDYNKERAIRELHEFSGFEYYEAKHLENKLTKIIQLVWFKEKFGVDKRTSHLSSLIVSGQMSREDALAEYNRPAYDKVQMEKDIDFVLDRLKISKSDFFTILNQPPKQHTDYKTSYWLTIKNDQQKLKLLRKLKAKLYL
jgi:putative lipopolysaccharide synthesis protein